MRTTRTIILAVLPFVAGCTRCEAPDDVQAIRAMILQAVDLAAAGDVRGLMRLATEEFVAHPGGLGRREARGVLLMAFKRYGRFDLRHPPPRISVGGDRRSAEVVLPFVIIREGAEAPEAGEFFDDPRDWFERVADMGDAYWLELDLVRTGEGWRAERARMRGTRGRWAL